MIIEWYKNIWAIKQKCCDKFIELYDKGFLDFQRDGVFLELPERVVVPLMADIVEVSQEDDHVQWQRIGKVEYCPFCGTKVTLEVTE